MKKTIKICSLLFLLLVITSSVVQAANNYNELRKTFSKSYYLKNNQKVKISNQFGKVDVKSWNKNEVKVDVTIIVFSKIERVAQSIMDGINIESTDGNPITFITKIAGNKNSKNNSSRMEINYIVYLPSSTPLDIKNVFGNINLPDWEGEINVNQSHGQIATGKIQNAQNIQVEFGELNSSTIKNGTFKISYSSLKIDQLLGNVVGRIDFCTGTRIGLQHSLTKLDLKASYSDITLVSPSNLNANVKINTSYGKLRNNSAIDLVDETKESKYGPVFNRVYRSKNPNGKVSISVSNTFGDIILK